VKGEFKIEFLATVDVGVTNLCSCRSFVNWHNCRLVKANCWTSRHLRAFLLLWTPLLDKISPPDWLQIFRILHVLSKEV
jgi:hypothetical protein